MLDLRNIRKKFGDQQYLHVLRKLLRCTLRDFHLQVLLSRNLSVVRQAAALVAGEAHDQK